MSYYMIAVIDVKDADLYQQYVQGVAQLLGGRQVKPLSVNAGMNIVAGDTDANLAAVLEFADEAEFNAFWNSDEYAEVRHLREKSADTRLILGLDGAVNL